MNQKYLITIALTAVVTATLVNAWGRCGTRPFRCGNELMRNDNDLVCGTVREGMIMRKASHKIDPIFLERYSGYALSSEPLSQEQIESLFTAASWAPSSYNIQPWRFVYATKGTEAWDKMIDTMVDFNKSWAHNAPLLILIVSQKNIPWNNQPAPTHSFDTGAAWAYLALQAARMGLTAHGMVGFDFDKARTFFAVPDDFSVEAMVAVGKPGSIEDLPESLQERARNVANSERKPLSEFVFNGSFGK